MGLNEHHDLQKRTAPKGRLIDHDDKNEDLCAERLDSRGETRELASHRVAMNELLADALHHEGLHALESGLRLRLVAARDRAFDAMADVIVQDLLLDPPQGGAHGGDLRHDVDAIAVGLDHAREPAHLALDPSEPFQAGGLGILLHEGYIPPRGI